jgi:hypothetical protein
VPVVNIGRKSTIDLVYVSQCNRRPKDRTKEDLFLPETEVAFVLELPAEESRTFALVVAAFLLSCGSYLFVDCI